ncbi:mitochondrial chaperone BCS1 [Triangularia verruculosa]|uniref:Mitochondrial chaperone BCS1 n=1 Tax=Triangularia verruculosa TaxID=2587418 RepID=A0AAN6XIX4_9PEZI|nr:mitochondrial chaperone BCS1 [Triangularia verruculosa]
MNETVSLPVVGLGSESPINPITMLDYLFPGFNLLANFLQTHLGINLNLYLPVLLSLSFVAAAWRYLSSWISDTVESHLMSVVDVRTDDEIYNMLMGWVAQQTFSQGARRFVANTNLNSRLYWWMWSRDDDDEEETDETGAIVSKEKKKKALAYTPTFGSHWFIYRRRLLIFRRQQPAQQNAFYSKSESEEISISCFGRNPWILKELLNEARQMYMKRDEAKTLIYRGTLKGTSLEPRWQRCMARTSRPFSTVILNEDVKKKLIEDVTDYLNPATRRWYANRGIPYRRGYLLWGPPGTGKSSLSLALAGFFKMRIYIVSLSSMTATEENLASLFAELPRRCVVLLEDIDTAGLTHTRDENNSDTSTSDTTDTTTTAVITDPKSPTGNKPVHPGRLSLSGLLNILDGVASQEGRVLIMTTNHLEKLDKALIRPGRVDMQVKFDKADPGMTSAIFRAIYAPLEEDNLPSSSPTTTTSSTSPALAALEKKLQSLTPGSSPVSGDQAQAQKEKEDKEKQQKLESTLQKITLLADEFASKIPTLEFSPAEIQGYLLKNKRDPEAAVAGVDEWLVVARKEQKEREVELALKKEEEAKKARKKAAKKAKKKAKKGKDKKKKKKVVVEESSDDDDDEDEDDSAAESDDDDASGSEDDGEGSGSESEEEKPKRKGRKKKAKKSGKKKKEENNTTVVAPVVEVRVDTPPPSGSEADAKIAGVPELTKLDNEQTAAAALVVVAAPAKTMTIDTKKANEEPVEKAQVSGDSGYGAASAVEAAA